MEMDLATTCKEPVPNPNPEIQQCPINYKNSQVLGARHPLKQRTSRPDSRRRVQVGVPRIESKKRAVPNLKREWWEHLTGYVGWWRNIER